MDQGSKEHSSLLRELVVKLLNLVDTQMSLQDTFAKSKDISELSSQIKDLERSLSNNNEDLLDLDRKFDQMLNTLNSIKEILSEIKNSEAKTKFLINFFIILNTILIILFTFLSYFLK